MKTLHLSIILVVLIAGLMLSYGNTAHGIWVPESTHDLLEKSATIFVGNITATKVLQFENQYSYLVEENGTDKNITKNYTMNLDEYTVDVEEYLKNPPNSNKITVRQPTVGIMGELGGLDGFKTGDHVLFYVKKLDGNNTYSPESFILPTFCNGKDVLTQERPEGGSNFTVIQNGVKVDYGNFTANEPIQFLSSKDMGTLSGKSYDLEVGITRNLGGNTETVFSKEIHSSSKPCEWIATVEWGFPPQEGNYEMGVIAKEGGIITGTSDSGFTVKSDTAYANQMPLLEQLRSGIAANDVKCKQGLQLIFKIEDNSSACVKQQTAQKLVERGWAKQESYYVDPHMSPKVSLYDYFYDGIDKDNTTVSINNRTYYQTTLNYTVDNLRKDTSIQFHGVTFDYIANPLMQFKSGIASKDVKCQDNFLLTFKAKDSSPACVKPETAQTLIMRGWGTFTVPSIDNTYDQKMNGTLSGNVVLSGGPRPGPQANYEVDVYATDGVTIVGKTLSDDNGNYSIQLSAGNYTIYASDYPTKQTHFVSVFSGKTTVFNIVYGIGYK